MLFAVEFDRRDRRRGVRAAAVYPDGIATELLRLLTPEVLKQVIPADAGKNERPPDKSVPQGAVGKKREIGR